jgi:RNA polymerase sigma factor (sigma-70 family)
MSEQDVVLKNRLMKKDTDALKIIIDDYSHYLYGVAATIISQNIGQRAQLIEEIVQDAFIFIWHHPEKYNPKRSSLKTYLSWKVISLSKNKRNKEKKEEKLFFSLINLYQFKSMPEWFDDTYLELFINMPEKARSIMVRRLILNEKPKQIQKDLSISIKEINNILFYYKKQLKKMIREELN